MRSMFDPHLESTTAGSKGGLALDVNERLLMLEGRSYLDVLECVIMLNREDFLRP